VSAPRVADFPCERAGGAEHLRHMMTDAEWSDREIARRCVVSADLVGEMRRALSVGNDRCAPPPRKATRKGTTYTQRPRPMREPARARMCGPSFLAGHLTQNRNTFGGLLRVLRRAARNTGEFGARAA